MIRLTIAIATVIFLLSSCATRNKNEYKKPKSKNCGKYGDFCNVKVVGVYDGDTFYIDLPKEHSLFGERLGIRVRGIDTPEIRTKSPFEKWAAYKAKDFTSNFLATAKKVDLTECSRGKYFRLVCHAIADKKYNLGEQLLEQGLAVPYDK